MAKTFLGSVRALVLPAALAGGLLIFGSQAAGAAVDPVHQYVVGGQIVTVVGGDISADMNAGSLHLLVRSGTTAIKIGDDSETINVAAGNEIVLSPTSDGSGMSLSL